MFRNTSPLLALLPAPALQCSLSLKSGQCGCPLMLSTQQSRLITVTVMNSEVTSAHHRNQFFWPKLALALTRSTITVCCLHFSGNLQLESSVSTSVWPVSLMVLRLLVLTSPIYFPLFFFFKGVHCAYFLFLFAFHWIKPYRNFVNFHVALAQGPCSSPYCSAVNTCAAEVSTRHRILHVLLSL